MNTLSWREPLPNLRQDDNGKWQPDLGCPLCEGVSHQDQRSLYGSGGIMVDVTIKNSTSKLLYVD